jgi:hypothetical protein
MTKALRPVAAAVLQGFWGAGSLIGIVKFHKRESGRSSHVEPGLDQAMDGGKGCLTHGLLGTRAAQHGGSFSQGWVHWIGCEEEGFWGVEWTGKGALRSASSSA